MTPQEIINTLIETYPLANNYTTDELETLARIYTITYEKIKEKIIDEEARKDREFENLVNLLIPHERIIIGRRRNALEIKFVPTDTTTLTQNEYNIIQNNPQRVFLTFSDRVINNFRFKKKIEPKENIELIKQREIQNISLTVQNNTIILQKSNSLSTQDNIYWIEAIAEYPIKIIRNGQEFFFSRFEKDQNGNIIITNQPYDALRNITNETVRISFYTTLTFSEITDRVGVEYDIDTIRMNKRVVLGDKDEIVLLFSDENIPEIYNLRVIENSGQYIVFLTEDREFITQKDAINKMMQVFQKPVIPAGVFVENGNVYLQFPSWVRDEFVLNPEEENIVLNITIIASKISDGGFKKDEDVTEEKEIFFNIYNVDTNTNIYKTTKGIIGKWVSKESMIFQNKPLSMLRTPKEIRTKTLITNSDVISLIKDDFEETSTIPRTHFIPSLSIFSDPTTFYCYVYGAKRELRLETDYWVEEVLRQDNPNNAQNITTTISNTQNLANEELILVFVRYFEDRGVDGTITEEIGLLPITLIDAKLENNTHFTWENQLYFYKKSLNNTNTRTRIETDLQNILDSSRVRRVYVYKIRKYSEALNEMVFNITQVVKEEATQEGSPHKLTIEATKPIFLEQRKEAEEIIRKLNNTIQPVILLANNIPISYVLVRITLDWDNGGDNNNNPVRLMRIRFTHENYDVVQIRYLASVLTQGSVKVKTNALPKITYEDQILNTHTNILPPFLNLKLYRIDKKTIFLRYKIIFTDIVTVDVRYRIKREVEEHIRRQRKVYPTVRETINNTTDQITSFLLQERYRRIVLETNLREIVVYNKTYGPENIMAIKDYEYIRYFPDVVVDI